MSDESSAQTEWPKDTWRLRLCLDIASSRLPAVQYGIFSQEPIAKFKEVLKRMEKPWLDKLKEITDEEMRRTVKEMQRAWAWNHLFRSVSGDEVYLLIPSSNDIALMSNALVGTKWIVSKPVVIDDRRRCWSIRFAAVPGDEVVVSLSEDNALYLSDIERASQELP
jgi:hypothetical protein